MSAPKASAFLALWNGHTQALDSRAYNTWHAFEHVPERLSVPGMCWAERYAVDPGVVTERPCFTWYGMADLGVLSHPAYQDLLDHPTPWSAHVRPHLTAFHRRPCTWLGRVGVGRGACLCTLEWSGVGEAWLAELPGVLAEAVGGAGLVSADWGRWAPGPAHPLDPPGAGAVGGVVLLLTHTDPGVLQATAAQLSAFAQRQEAPLQTSPVYRLQSVACAADLPGQGRPAPLTDLWARVVSGT
jgi:hypothetical protein